MRTVEKLTDLKYVNIFKVIDPDNNVGGYLYAERLGKDSIAFICYDEDSEQFLVNSEYKPPIDKFVTGAFGGSIDKNLSLIQIVVNECEEEAGFKVKPSDVKFVGKMLVSTQMNQYCYLYLVLVDKNNQGNRKPENKIEAMAKTEWIRYSDANDLEDWKAITIISLAERKGMIGVV